MTNTLVKSYLGFGLAASRPASPAVDAAAIAFYYATDTNVLSVWNGSAWSNVGATPGMSLIQTLTPTSGSVATFSGIPATYSHLLIEGCATTNDAVTAQLSAVTFNSDTGAHYDYQGLEVGGSVVTENGYGVTNLPRCFFFTGSSAPSGQVGTGKMLIKNYANPNVFKAGEYQAGNWGGTSSGSTNYDAGTFQWRSTAAINRIDITVLAGAFTGNGNIFSLYGIL